MASKRTYSNDHGFIHNLSPIKKSLKSKHQWYEFQLQTSPTKVKRLVGFNLYVHDSLKHFEETKSPVQLKNIIVKDDNECIFNQQSAVHKAGLSDVSFCYTEQPKLESAGESSAAKSVTVSNVKGLHPNQKVNVSGSLTMGKEDLKAVVLRSTGATAHVKEDCVLEDNTGSSMIHIWEPLVHTLTTGKSYCFTNLTVKNFQGSTYLSTSPNTTANLTTQTVQTLTGPDMLKSPEKEVTASEFNLVSKLNIFCSCKVCKKRLNDVESFTCTTLKCENCGTRQRSRDIKLQASAKISITESEGDNSKEMWIQAFTEPLETLLAGSTLSLKDKIDDIEVYLMSLEDICLVYNVQTTNITKILSFKRPEVHSD